MQVDASTNAFVLHAIFFSDDLAEQLNGSSLQIDELSIVAASKWALENNQHALHPTIHKISSSLAGGWGSNVSALCSWLHIAFFDNFFMTTAPAPETGVLAAAPVADPAIRWLQPALIVRLLIAGFVFGYNKELTDQKKVGMGCE